MTDSLPDNYFQRRAEEEREAAEQAADERAAQSHRELAERYEKLAGQGSREVVGIEDVQQPRGSLPREFRILP